MGHDRLKDLGFAVQTDQKQELHLGFLINIITNIKAFQTPRPPRLEGRS